MVEKLEETQRKKRSNTTKKVFFRRSIENDRLGQEVYTKNYASQESTYVVRKFELGKEYEVVEQVTALVTILAEQFDQKFEKICRVRTMYMRVRPQKIYITCLLAIEIPLTKEVMSKLHLWFDQLDVSKLSTIYAAEKSKATKVQESQDELRSLRKEITQLNEKIDELTKSIAAVQEQQKTAVFKVVHSMDIKKRNQETISEQVQVANKENVIQLENYFKELRKDVDKKVAEFSRIQKRPTIKFLRKSQETENVTIENKKEMEPKEPVTAIINPISTDKSTEEITFVKRQKKETKVDNEIPQPNASEGSEKEHKKELLNKKENQATDKKSASAQLTKKNVLEALEKNSNTPKKKKAMKSDDSESKKSSTDPIREEMQQLETSMISLFKKNEGIRTNLLISKEDFFAMIRKIEVVPYLWLSINDLEGKDIVLGGELSCQALIDALPSFLEQVDTISQKRKFMGRWIYCPKEIESKMEGYQQLNNYLDYFQAMKNEKELT